MKTPYLSIIAFAIMVILLPFNMIYGQSTNSTSDKYPTVHVDVKYVVRPPLQQYKSGIAAHYIKCEEGLHLIIKAEDGTPACVKSDTASILVERGWGMSMTSIHDVLNQEMNGTLSGNVVLAGGPHHLGSQANYEVDVYATDGITIVGKALSDDNGNYSIQLPAGIYTIYAPDYPTRQTHHVSVISGKDTILNIIYGTGYR